MPLAMENIDLGLQYSKGKLQILTQDWVLVLFIVEGTKSYVQVNNLKKQEIIAMNPSREPTACLLKKRTQTHKNPSQERLLSTVQQHFTQAATFQLKQGV